MINLFLVVISCQFAETRKRETERMIAERETEAKLLSEEQGGGNKLNVRLEHT